MANDDNLPNDDQATTPEEMPVETLNAEDFAEDAAGATDAPTVEQQLADEQDRNLRLQAELQNVLSRKSREVADERKYGALPILRDLLPVLDNIDRAIESAANQEAASAESLIEGFRLVRQQLITLFEQHQCLPIPTEGEAFNPDLHEAILQQPSPDHEAGQIIMTTQSGFKLHDRVVRPAQVIVSAGAPDA